MISVRHKTWWIFGAVASSAVAYFAGSALAQGIPLQEPLVYTGQLSDSDGKPSDGRFDIDIMLWQSATGGGSDERLCETSARDLNVSNGHFQVALDQDCLAAVSNNSNVWVDVHVNGESLGRTKIAAVPYAVIARQAEVAAPEGELATKLAELQKQLDEQRDFIDEQKGRADAQDARLDGYDSGWIPLGTGESTSVEHGLGEIPRYVTVLVKDKDGGVHVSGSTWAYRDELGNRGVLVTDMTTTSLSLHTGSAANCSLFDTYGTGGERRCVTTGGQVRVLARL